LKLVEEISLFLTILVIIKDPRMT